MSKKIKLKEAAEKLRFKEKVVAKVEQHPMLYDKENPSYMNTNEKIKIWNQIARELGCCVKDLKAKWKSLRDQYVKEKKAREEETKSGAGASTRFKFPLFDQMGFLEGCLRKRRSLSTMDQEEEGDQENKEKEENTEDMDKAADDPELQNELNVFDATQMASQDFDSIEEGTSSKASEALFPETAPKGTRTSPRKIGGKGESSQPVTPVPEKKAKISQPLSQNIPFLSPAKDKSGPAHSARSKAKKEEEINKELQRVVGVLDKAVSGGASQKPTQDDRDLSLGMALRTALKEMKTDAVRNKWRRTLRNALCDMEDDISSELDWDHH